MDKQISKALKTGAWITATILLVNYVLTFLNIEVTEVFGVSPATGVTSTIGQKVLDTLQSIVAFDLMSIATLYISAVLIYFVGSWLYGMFKIPQTNKNWAELAAVLFWGTAVFYLLLVGFGMPAVGTLVGVGIYYLVIALSLNVLQKTVSKLNLI